MASVRQQRGRRSDLCGRMAEDMTVSTYLGDGCDILERRWRGLSGEIDLIVREGETIVFVEVKSSSTHARAAERLERRQLDRICLAATEYCGIDSTEMRFDAALVDSYGRVEILRNAFGMN